MAKKTEDIKKTLEIASEEEILEVQDEINEELLKEKKEDEKNKKVNPTYLFFTFFLKRLKEDKLYLFSFIVTIVFLGFFSVTKLQETEGYYDKKNESKVNDNVVVPTVNTDLNQEKSDDKASEELDVSDYVGIYSKEYKFEKTIKFNDKEIDSYKLVYQIKKDKSIAKYFVSSNIGTIKIWDGKLDYVSSGGARYISANYINYLFSNNGMKEVDGETYKKDDSISSLKENKKIDGVDIYFMNSNIVLASDNDLLSLKGNATNYHLTDKYKINDKIKEKIVYKEKDTNNFNFIIFEEKEDKKCYSLEEISDENFKDEVMYTIYSLEYDEELDTFANEVEVLKRNKSAGCDVLEEDILKLEK